MEPSQQPHADWGAGADPVRQVAAVVRTIGDEYEFPIFLNADHTNSAGQGRGSWNSRVRHDRFRRVRSRGSGAGSCRETRVFRDLHGAYAISGNPRCIGDGG